METKKEKGREPGELTHRSDSPDPRTIPTIHLAPSKSVWLTRRTSNNWNASD